MKLFIEMRAMQGYGSVSDYVRHLIRKDERKYNERRLEAIERQNMYRYETSSQNAEVDLGYDDYPD